MSEKNGRDLTTEELLKKLMENFGDNVSEDGPEGRQLSIEDTTAASEGKRKVYHYRVNHAAKEQSENQPSERDDVGNDIDRAIMDAEKYVESMRDFPDDGKADAPDGENERKDFEKQIPESGEKNYEDSERIGALLMFDGEDDREENRHSEPKAKDERDGENIPDVECARNTANAEEIHVEEELPAREEIPAEEEFPAGEEIPAGEEFPAGEAFSAEEELPVEAEDVLSGVESERDGGNSKSDNFQEHSDVGNIPEEVLPFRKKRKRKPLENAARKEKDQGEDGTVFESVEHARNGTESAENRDIPEEDAENAEKAKNGETSETNGDLDENEVNLMMIFEMENDLEKRLGSEELKKIRRKIDGDAKAGTVEEEYETPDQNVRFFEKFRKNYTGLTVRTVVAAVALVLVAVGEILFTTLERSEMMSEGGFFFSIPGNPVFTALAAMQITMLLLAVGYKEILTGLRAIGTGRAVPEVFLALTGLFTLVYELGLIKCHSVHATFYNLPLALGVLLAVIHTRSSIRRKLLAFKIVSTRKKKFVVTHRSSSDSLLEKEAFDDFISDSSGIYGTEETSFIRGFGRRTAKEPRYKAIIGIFATAVTVIALVFFVLGYYFSESDEKLLMAFQTAMQAVLFTVPLSAFLTYCLPFGRAVDKAFHLESAIIGEFSLEEYSDATVISFDDKEVFPPKNVRVRSLKLYGNSRIDHVLFGAASVFHRLGGPLDEVFGVATKESGYSEDVDILEVEKDGVEAAVKGARVYVGGSSFMKARGLLPSVDPDDEAMELDGRMSVMYLAISGELAAKMYVEYTPDAELESIMKSLYKAGMCVGIRTLDPNIDDKMLRSHVDLSKYPVKVLRMEAPSQEKQDSIDSGVVSRKSVKNLLKTLTYCRRVLQVIRADTIIKVVSILAGVGISALVLFLGLTAQVTSLWVMVYQLLTLLPILLISFIFV